MPVCAFPSDLSTSSHRPRLLFTLASSYIPTLPCCSAVPISNGSSAQIPHLNAFSDPWLLSVLLLDCCCSTNDESTRRYRTSLMSN
ncbi:hypothetical protein BDN70DRAFT_454451 [Pholiota conissans]|uniref:Uncharacterized protein n=1 Tax=Pholiota conissans TaxID=109636 RepID=A0A9P5YQ07_9AGAR|nr:hypothetical protein BDN70DRAFT_454451 [Pholiota conissans]